MARKTRNQIIDKRRQALQAMERVMENLKGIEELADGRSEYINKMLVYAIVLVDRCNDGLKDILSKL